MTITFRCDDKDMLVAYLYDEVDAEQRRQVEAHLRTCLACLTEVESLRHVRQDLAAWQPPEMNLNFQIAQRPATVLRPPRWSLPSLPAWGKAVAAVLLFATGLAIANIQVRYGHEGLSVTTGWSQPAGQAPIAPTAVGVNSSVPAADEWRPALAALESDLRNELQLLRSAAAESSVRRASVPQSVDTESLMRRIDVRVDARISESEQRQRRELALRIGQFNNEIQVQRNSDLRLIRSGIGESQREMWNLMRSVRTTPVP